MSNKPLTNKELQNLLAESPDDYVVELMDSRYQLSSPLREDDVKVGKRAVVIFIP